MSGDMGLGHDLGSLSYPLDVDKFDRWNIINHVSLWKKEDDRIFCGSYQLGWLNVPYLLNKIENG